MKIQSRRVLSLLLCLSVMCASFSLRLSAAALGGEAVALAPNAGVTLDRSASIYFGRYYQSEVPMEEATYRDSNGKKAVKDGYVELFCTKSRYYRDETGQYVSDMFKYFYYVEQPVLWRVYDARSPSAAVILSDRALESRGTFLNQLGWSQDNVFEETNYYKSLNTTVKNRSFSEPEQKLFAQGSDINLPSHAMLTDAYYFPDDASRLLYVTEYAACDGYLAASGMQMHDINVHPTSYWSSSFSYWLDDTFLKDSLIFVGADGRIHEEGEGVSFNFSTSTSEGYYTMRWVSKLDLSRVVFAKELSADAPAQNKAVVSSDGFPAPAQNNGSEKLYVLSVLDETLETPIPARDTLRAAVGEAPQIAFSQGVRDGDTIACKIFAADGTLVGYQESQAAGGAVTLETQTVYKDGGAPRALTQGGYFVQMYKLAANEETVTYSASMPVTISLDLTDATDLHRLSILSDNGASTGAGLYAAGADVTLRATPAEGYTFAGWYENGALLSSENPYTIENLSASRTLRASFVKKQFTLRVRITGEMNATGTVSGDGVYGYMDKAILKAAPVGTNVFDGWYADGVRISPYAEYEYYLTQDTEITARFLPAPYSCTAIAGEGGKIKNNAGREQDQITSRVLYGQQFTAKAAPSSGYKLTGWYLNGELVGTDLEFTHTVTEPFTVFAYFELALEVTANAENGTVYGTGKVGHNGAVTLVAVPDMGYRFAGWYENEKLVSEEVTLALTNLTQNRSFEARFEPLNVRQPQDARIDIAASGPVRVNGASLTDGTFAANGVPHGTNYELCAESTADNRFQFWLDNDTQRILSYSATYELTVSSSKSITAVFTGSVQQDTYTISFVDSNNRLLQTYLADESSQSFRSQENAQRAGYRFLGWTIRGANHLLSLESLQPQQDMILQAVYAADGGANHRVTLADGTFLADKTMRERQIQHNTRTTVAADAPPQGEQFLFWLKNGSQIVSYETTYSFIVMEGTHLQAVFADGSMAQTPLLYISEGLADVSAGTISYHIEWELPQEMTLVGAGILWSDGAYAGRVEDFVIDAPQITTRTSHVKDRHGQYLWTKTGLTDLDEVFARGYLTFAMEDGSVYTIYTDLSHAAFF